MGKILWRGERTGETRGNDELEGGGGGGGVGQHDRATKEGGDKKRPSASEWIKRKGQTKGVTKLRVGKKLAGHNKQHKRSHSVVSNRDLAECKGKGLETRGTFRGTAQKLAVGMTPFCFSKALNKGCGKWGMQ